MNYEVIRKGVDTGHHLFYVFFLKKKFKIQ